MFVKVYEYYVREECIEEYLTIQEKAGEIYDKYIDAHTIYLRSKKDEAKWMEITRYKSEEEYRKVYLS
ncbi:hypothetical protein [Pseudalkalibacillus hwajinpoensis]|uniref:hypothetical protein n=1 Tax=Guptibacillus hwajinpoensis TaxID=208199 RepID=UPI001F114DEC|nr:hypothetical protein [Pseudalkalibacillus hwajinpoensis]